MVSIVGELSESVKDLNVPLNTAIYGLKCISLSDKS